MADLIEVVGVDMRCFKVQPGTLEPVGGSYYEPAAWSDPRGPQIGINEWQAERNRLRCKPHHKEPSNG